jgi:F-type H+-transporting ATPase subunit b
MDRILRACGRLGAVALASLPAVALAAGGGHDAHGFDAKTFAFQLLNFGVLVFLLVKFGGGAINKSLKARHEQMKTDLDEANRLKKEAEARLAEQDQRLGSLEQELQRLRASLADEAKHEEQKLLAAAEERAQRVKDETKFLLAQQVKEAELRFRGEVAAAAVRIAEELVKKSLLPDDEQRLAQAFVTELERPASPGAQGRN